MKVETAEAVAIKDALVALLNAGSEAGEFSKAFVAAREYDPEYELEELETLHVTVVASKLTMSRLNRGNVWQRDYEVDVAVEQRGEGRPAIDELMKLPEEVATYCGGTVLAGYPAAVMMGAAVDPLYVPSWLRADGLFLSVVRLTYRTVR